MNGYGQEINVLEQALRDAMTTYNERAGKQEQLAAMQNSGNPFQAMGATLGNALFQRGKPSMKDAEAQYLEAEFKRNQAIGQAQAEQAQQQAIAKREQELDDEQRKYAHELNKITTKGGIDSQIKADDRTFNRSMQEDRQSFQSGQTKEQREYEKANQKPDFKQGDSLRTEFQSSPIVKDFDAVNVSMQKVMSSAKEPSPATDIALITGFMKMNDPGSTVREGEFATAANAGSVDEKLRNVYNGMVNGQRLTDEQRDYFVNSAGRLYQSHVNQYEKHKSQYSELAARQGLDPESIFIKRDKVEWNQPKEQTQPTQNMDFSSMSDDELQALEAKLLQEGG